MVGALCVPGVCTVHRLVLTPTVTTFEHHAALCPRLCDRAVRARAALCARAALRKPPLSPRCTRHRYRRRSNLTRSLLPCIVRRRRAAFANRVARALSRRRRSRRGVATRAARRRPRPAALPYWFAAAVPRSRRLSQRKISDHSPSPPPRPIHVLLSRRPSRLCPRHRSRAAGRHRRQKPVCCGTRLG